MKKQRSAHEVIKALILEGYCYRQLHACYGLSISTMHNMNENEDYSESAKVRDLLNSKRPSEPPRWKKK